MIKTHRIVILVGLVSWGFMIQFAHYSYSATEFEKITASDASVNDAFGQSVAISGNIALVSAWEDDEAGFGSNSGSAYFFQDDGFGNWVEFEKITASDGAIDDHFGSSVALEGNTAVIGAHLDDHPIVGSNAGSAYIFQDDGSGNWNEITKLTSSDIDSTDGFGYAVALSGNTTLVGAYGENGRSGSAYIYQDDGLGNWNEVTKITANDADSDDQFGYAVALSGDKALIGAHYNDDDGSDSGSAYIFQDDGLGNWNQIAKLISNDAAAEDWFGLSVALDGNTALVGARNDDDGGFQSGSAYVFQDDGLGNWNQIAKLTADDAAAGAWFGSTVALSGDLAIVGAYGDEHAGYYSGATYVFQHDGVGNWNQISKLTASDAAPEDQFGFAVALSGTTALVSAHFNDDAGSKSGAAYLYQVPEPTTFSIISIVGLVLGFSRISVKHCLSD